MRPSLREVHGSIAVPQDAGFWRKLFAFAGPGYLVAVGYMDPGNWATDLAGGARYGYTLLSVILISNLMAILLQALAVRLGIASGRDLAQACRDSYSKPVTIVLWVLCEIAIAACDLAEVIGAAIALNLLFGLPLIWGVSLTALDVLLILFLQHRGFRYVEALVVALIVAIAGSFAIQILLARPDPGALAGWIHPADRRSSPTRRCCTSRSAFSGATVMPHNLYLHSSIVQTRRYTDTLASKSGSDSVRDARFFDRADVGALHQRGDPDRLRRGVPRHGPRVGRRHRRRASAPVSAARDERGRNPVRRRAAVLGAERDVDGHAGGSDRDGGLRQHPPATVAPSPHHPARRHHPGSHRRQPVWRARHGRVADPEPGHPEPAVAVCRVSARQLHEQSPARWASSSRRDGFRRWRGRSPLSLRH